METAASLPLKGEKELYDGSSTLNKSKSGRRVKARRGLRKMREGSYGKRERKPPPVRDTAKKSRPRATETPGWEGACKDERELLSFWGI